MNANHIDIVSAERADDLIKPKNELERLLQASYGVLSMSGIKHPDGYYTLGETGHFQVLQKAYNEIKAGLPR